MAYTNKSFYLQRASVLVIANLPRIEAVVVREAREPSRRLSFQASFRRRKVDWILRNGEIQRTKGTRLDQGSILLHRGAAVLK